MKRLPLLCPQEYRGVQMCVVRCTRCTFWEGTRCAVEMGVEHLPFVPDVDVPLCPIQHVCQHQAQANGPCPVRARGLVCESALVLAGMDADEAYNCALAFNASNVTTEEELYEEAR